ncbi:MAG: C_GCAxxG_C_C family protein [Candidatus Heimdallarchaeota archaeon]|nr:C_GCAxxG_C_C family protein [Candidatus Heimdallarchaeota archaeon]
MSKDIKERALEYFHGDYNCAQAVLRAVLEEKNLFFSDAPAIAANFGGGIIGRGEICGAVSGALMAIGVIASKKEETITEQKKLANEIAKKFYEEFEKIFNHNTCNGLIGIDRKDPDARQKAVDAGLYRDNCPKFVAQAAKIVLDLFSD